MLGPAAYLGIACIGGAARDRTSLRRLTLYFFLLAAFGLAAIISYRSRASCYIIVSVPPPRPCRMGKAERRQAGSRRCLQH